MKRRTYSKEFVDRKIVFRLRMFLVLLGMMLMIVIYDISHDYISSARALAAIASGAVLGWMIGSASNVMWHPEASKVMMKMDIISGVILALYIVFAIFKTSIFRQWFYGKELSAFVLCLTAGIVLGRFLSIRKLVINVLREQGKH